MPLEIGEKTSLLLLSVDPATGTKTKEFVVSVIRIRKMLNNSGRKRRSCIGGKLIKIYSVIVRT